MLVVDQLEELFTGDVSESVQTKFVRALTSLAEGGRCLDIGCEYVNELR